MKSVSIVGLGYVGLPLAQLFIEKGFMAYGIDANPLRVDEITRLNPDFEEVTTEFNNVHKSDIIVICVPTPVYADKTPDVSIINSCLRHVAGQLKSGQLLIIESTVHPGYCEDIAVPILEEYSGLAVGKDIFLAHCPERINPGDKKWNIKNIPRVLGGINIESLRLAEECYRSILDAEVHPMKSIIEAEAVKIVENTFRDINIAFVNELAMSFEKTGIDITNVIAGASTKPFGFMAHYPSIGVGGHCIPVDPYYLIESAKNRGYNHRFLSLAREINEGMVEYLFKKIENAIEKQNLERGGLKLVVLGIAYKQNQSDTRESPGLRFAKYAANNGLEVKMYDPYVSGRSDFKSVDQALSWADVAVIATAHDEFRELTMDSFNMNCVKIVIDGQNILENNNSETMYIGVGR